MLFGACSPALVNLIARPLRYRLSGSTSDTLGSVIGFYGNARGTRVYGDALDNLFGHGRDKRVRRVSRLQQGDKCGIC